eukprot:2313340-Rhodomonas_salina.1
MGKFRLRRSLPITWLVLAPLCMLARLVQNGTISQYHARTKSTGTGHRVGWYSSLRHISTGHRVAKSSPRISQYRTS